ncbi:unnamed protein product [Cyprideis torosa]|uniref:Uncharacterized protein n=1 Tax=Cyprideis torosa TaxID=163714 RepID=A0A7R8ZKZ5_9CRUS|nr:unnamed protein product [Cyprideis torosa]CAG0892216.1 unnamed protein product [Cyprideis torosa]
MLGLFLHRFPLLLHHTTFNPSVVSRQDHDGDQKPHRRDPSKLTLVPEFFPRRLRERSRSRGARVLRVGRGDPHRLDPTMFTVSTRPIETISTRPIETISTRPIENVPMQPPETVSTRPSEKEEKSKEACAEAQAVEGRPSAGGSTCSCGTTVIPMPPYPCRTSDVINYAGSIAVAFIGIAAQVVAECWTMDDTILCLMSSAFLLYGSIQIICSSEYLIFGIASAMLTGIYSNHLRSIATCELVFPETVLFTIGLTLSVKCVLEFYGLIWLP